MIMILLLCKKNKNNQAFLVYASEYIVNFKVSMHYKHSYSRTLLCSHTHHSPNKKLTYIILFHDLQK